MAVSKRTRSIKSAVDSMSDDQLLCRDFGHSWQPFTARWVAQQRAYAEALRCQRCHTLRRRLISQRGEQLTNSYAYTPGYLVAGLGRLDADDRCVMRLEAIQTIMNLGLPEADADADADEPTPSAPHIRSVPA